jgi:hypothetical protein
VGDGAKTEYVVLLSGMRRPCGKGAKNLFWTNFLKLKKNNNRLILKHHQEGLWVSMLKESGV